MKNIRNHIITALVSVALATAMTVGAVTLLTVPQGGTGAGTFTDGGVLFGNATGAIQVSGVLTEGQLLIGDGTTEPAIDVMSGDATLASTGALTIAADAVHDSMIDWGAGASQVEVTDLEGTDNILLETEIDASSELLALMDDETGTGVLVFGTAPTFTTSITVTGADADPAAAGEIRYDSTVAGMSGGALRWYDDDSVRILVDLETDATDDDYVVAYDAAADGFYMKLDADSGGATAYDDIEDPDAATTITFADTEIITYSNASDGEVFFLLDNTDADLANDTTLLALQYTDNNDANMFFLKCIDDSGGTPDTHFSIGATGNTIISGSVAVGTETTDSITMNGTGKALQLAVWGDDVANEWISALLRASDTHSPTMIIGRARGDQGTPTAVADNDIIGQIGFMAYDGTDYGFGGYIRTLVDGTPGDDDLPTEMKFATTQDGATTPTLALTIGPTQTATFAGTVTAVGSFIIGAADMSEADLEKLDGITNGTAAADKAVVLDASLDIGTINILKATSLVGALTGNASTATALAANGGNCAAGSYPLGVDASGAIEDCTDATTEINTEIGNVLDGTDVFTDFNSTDILTHADILDTDQADTKCLWFEDPTADDDFKSIWANKTANDFQVTEIWAESDQTVTFMLQLDDGTPADCDTVDLAPAAGEAEDTSLDGDCLVAAGEELDLDIASVGSTPTWVSICFTGNWVD
jgi:hypothetical protein